MVDFYKDKTVLITGAAGTVGKELIKQLLHNDEVKAIVALDNNETELFFLAQEYREHPNIIFHLVDIRDEENLTHKMNDVDVVIHTAAYKHVLFCEASPDEAIKTNIIGLQNVIASAAAKGVRWLAFTSTDKAVNPTSVMGTSKLMGERIVTAANRDHENNNTKMFSVRFGNILGSRGSVMPIFYEQIRKGREITLTDRGMTRFVMTIEQSARLILNSVPIAKGGEVIVTKMPVIRISDLAEVMIEALGNQFGHKPEDIPIKLIGMQPGEKIYEELMSDQEVARSLNVKDYLIIPPNYRQSTKNIYDVVLEAPIDKPYNSANSIALTRSQLHQFLLQEELLSYRQSNQYYPNERFYYVT